MILSPPPPAARIRLEKAATDNGFDQARPTEVHWLSFESSQASLALWLTTDSTGRPIAALSRSDVVTALADCGLPVTDGLPAGAAAACAVQDHAALDRLLRRAFQLARALPNELLHVFEQEVAAMPRSTDAERLVVERVGQNIFRAGLIDYWDGRCAVSGLDVRALLKASHIKPWSTCATDAERLDVFNGLLLAPNFDAAFDAGFITFADDGTMIVSSMLDRAPRELLGLGEHRRIERLADGHRRYLAWHRAHEFEKKHTPSA